FCEWLKVVVARRACGEVEPVAESERRCLAAGEGFEHLGGIPPREIRPSLPIVFDAFCPGRACATGEVEGRVEVDQGFGEASIRLVTVRRLQEMVDRTVLDRVVLPLEELTCADGEDDDEKQSQTAPGPRNPFGTREPPPFPGCPGGAREVGNLEQPV